VSLTHGGTRLAWKAASLTRATGSR
jgi:hypothetical protein